MRISIILYLIIVVSCSTVEDEVNTIKLDPSDTEQLNYSSFIKNHEFVKLSTGENSYIGTIDKIEITEDRIYVLDSRRSVSLYIFDRDGNLDFKIANYGRGPGEFMGPYDFAIDEKRNEIIIFDARALKLCYYDIEDGSFLREVNLDFQFFRFAVTDNNYIFFLNNIASKYQHNIIITDKELNVLETDLELDNSMIGYHFALPTNFSSYNNQLLLTAPSDYNIYSFGENGFENYKYIDFGSYALPDSYYKEHPNNQSRRDEIGNSAYHVTNYNETDTFIFFKYSKGDRGSQYYLQSKRSELIYHTSFDKMNDDAGVGPLPLWALALKGNTIVWSQESATLLRHLYQTKENSNADEWREFENENMQLISFAETLSENDNPYLIFTEIDF